MHACERCYSRKTKCDRRLPQCSSCIKGQSRCQYPNKRRDRELQQEYIKSVKQRLNELEQENKQLRESVSSQTYALEPDNNAEQADPSVVTTRAQSTSHRQYSHEPTHVDIQQSPAQSAGSIQRTPGEEARYLGSSNGVDFVDVVERVVDSSHTTGGLFGRVTESHRLPDKVALPSITQPAGLVDREIAMPLITSYFDHWHLLFPLLYRPAFMQMVEQMYTDPHIYQNNATCAFAFDIVLAMGSVPSKTVEWGFRDAESHFARALTHLDEVSSLHGIQSLQAMLLYCKYGIHASLRDTSSEMWEALGKATRLCVEIGLHTDTSVPLAKCRTHITGIIPDSVQVEMQRRCFWCYYNLERIVSISLGRPLALHDDDIHVPLPSAASDDTFAQAPGETNPSLQTVSPFLQHIKLRKIQSKIHRSMYTSRWIQALPLNERQAIRREIFNELQAWRNDVILLGLPSIDEPSTIASSYLLSNWYQALYHSCCLLLFRPSTTFPAMEGLESDEDMDDVLQMIWNSSRLVLAKYFDLLRARHLNYSWVCLYTIFMAGLANMYAVGCCAKRRKRGIMAFLPSLLDVISDVRDCSNILTAICERWDDARVSCDIFNRLSTSAMRELVASTFEQKDDRGIGFKEDSRNNQIVAQPNLMLGGNGHNIPPTTGLNSPRFSSHQGFPSQIFPGPFPLGEFPDDALGNFDPIVDFQQMFQEMQDSINTSGQMEANEVMLGFSQEWFER